MSGLSLYHGDSQASKNTCVDPQVQGLEPEDPSARPTRPPPPSQLLSHPPLVLLQCRPPRARDHPRRSPPPPPLPLGTVPSLFPSGNCFPPYLLAWQALLIPTSHPRLLPRPAPGPYPEGVDQSVPPAPHSPGRFLPPQHIPRGPCTLPCNLFMFSPHPFLRLS